MEKRNGAELPAVRRPDISVGLLIASGLAVLFAAMASFIASQWLSLARAPESHAGGNVGGAEL